MGERGSIVDQAIGRLRGALVLAQPSDMAAVTARAANDEDGLAPLAMAPAR